MKRSLWPRKSPPSSPPTTTRCRRSPYSTERCIAVSTQMCTNNERSPYHGGAQGLFFVFCFVCVCGSACACVRVINSGVGRQAVRSCGEEGAAQRGVSLPPLHGLRSRGGVQEDAAGENACGVDSPERTTAVRGFRVARVTLTQMTSRPSGRQEWPCTKLSRRTRTTSGQS